MVASGGTKRGPTGKAKESPRGEIGTSIAIAKAIYDAGKSGIEFTQKLREVAKGEVALGVNVHESFVQGDRFYLLINVHNYSPHGVVIEGVVPTFPEKSKITPYLLVAKDANLGYLSDYPPPTTTTAPTDLGFRLAPFSDPVRVPAGEAQDFLLSWDQKDVLARIHSQRRGSVNIRYEILGSGADAKSEPVEFRFRTDRPSRASHTR